MQKVKGFLLSPRTVICLIAGVGISCLFGSIIPQITEKSPQFFDAWKAKNPRIYFLIDLLQLNHIYTSIWFLILIALIACSLCYSIYYQSKILRKSTGPTRREITENSFKDFLTLRLVQGSGFRVQGLKVGVEGFAPVIKKVFRAKGYRLSFPPDGKGDYLIFSKNRWAKWGSIIFHLGLVCIIVTALYSLAFQKRGFTQVIQGDTFTGRDKDWQANNLGVFASDFDLGFRVRLNRFTPTYWDTDEVKGIESDITITDQSGRAKNFLLSVNNPIYFQGIKIYQSNDYGYALGFILDSKEAAPAITHFLLNAPTKKDKPLVGEMDFPSTDYILDMRFYPNLIEPSFYATLPGVDLIVMEKGEQRFKGRVLFSQRARLNEDSLNFMLIRYWSGLIFVKNYGIFFVYVGFALSAMGAFLIFMLPYKEMYLSVVEEGDQVRIVLGGRTKRYQAIFSEEFKEIAGRLEKRLKVPNGTNRIAQI
ncbi:MAG: cytochrome c biogenesis protein ResB [Desulfobacterales bacterium]|nr:cytochrome c biogenesis protein ResB [Desulfobacterales bacterium]